MKTKFLLWLMFAFCSVTAQTKKPPVPETLNEVSGYRKVDNTLLPLEKNQSEYITKYKSFGYGGVSNNFVLAGDKSAIRITVRDSIGFVVAISDGAGDPTTAFSLFKVEVKKGKRIANYANHKAYFGKSGSGDGMLTFTVKRIGNQGYELVPSARLEKGEYVFVNRNTMGNYGGKGADAFAFGID